MKDIAYEIIKNPKYDECQRKLTSMVSVSDKKTGSETSVNEELAEELHKPVIKKFQRRKVYESIRDLETISGLHIYLE